MTPAAWKRGLTWSRPSAKRLVLNVLIVFHLLAVVSVSFPMAGGLPRTSWLRTYARRVGLSQVWTMFITTPSRVVHHQLAGIDAEIVFADGARRLCVVTPVRSGFFRRARAALYRKMTFRSRDPWRDIAERIARPDGACGRDGASSIVDARFFATFISMRTVPAPARQDAVLTKERKLFRTVRFNGRAK